MGRRPAVAPAARTTTVEVRVALKPGVLDAEAESVEKSLGLLGIRDLVRVTTARIYTLTFSGIDPAEAEARARRAVDELLANPVIHHVEILPRSG
jgi:phosphoribosylformylglycinamidine synthase PurS subunit